MALATAPNFARLRHVNLYRTRVTAKGVDALLNGPHCRIAELELGGYDLGADLVDVLAKSPQLARLTKLGLSFTPSLGGFTQVAGGAMDWQAQLQPGMSGFPTVAPDDIWAPSRNVPSVPVQVANEREQFIFYRGLGAFDVPFRATANADDTLTLKNDSPDAISRVFLLRLHSAGGAIIDLGALAPGQSLANIVPPVEGKEMNVDQYVADASAKVAASLVATGLTPDEARAMVDTWSRSYFRTFGLRVLYTVPRTWTDRLLPLTIDPKPDALVRTLVGRVEVLTPADESQIVTAVQSAAAAAMPQSQLITNLGRFAEPKLRRAQQLIADPSLQSYLSAAVAQAQQQP